MNLAILKKGPGWDVVVESSRAFEAEDRLEIWIHRKDGQAYPLVQNTLEGALLLTSLQRYEADFYSLNHRHQLATANLEGKIRALAGETRRVEELDKAVSRAWVGEIDSRASSGRHGSEFLLAPAKLGGFLSNLERVATTVQPFQKH